MAVARALVLKPRFIVADEPVSMLDVSIRAEILDLMLKLKEKYSLTYFFITHDLSVARYFSDRIAVMYLGKIVELTDSNSLIQNPLHPYTMALKQAVPDPDPANRQLVRSVAIKGDVPSPTDIPTGCRFHTRCLYAVDNCRKVEPSLLEVERSHYVACFKYGTS